jgi:tRNA pseudouridine55 synthase
VSGQAGEGPHGLVVVDKPGGWTSFDVVARMRRLAGTRRVGHAGTLDPMATGVLVIGIGKATKLLGHLALTGKVYRATIRLGETTNTDDAEGEQLGATPAGDLDEAAVRKALEAFTGEITQVPPQISAIKVDGKRSYARARAGETVELAARTVTVSRLDLESLRRGGPTLDLDVEIACSSGTYIRSIARDLGEALGVGGHLTALRRTRVGRYGLAEAHTLDRLAESPRLSYTLDEACLLGFPRRDLTDAESESASNGRALAPVGIDGVYAATAPDGRVIALLADDGSRTKSIVVIRPSTL